MAAPQTKYAIFFAEGEDGHFYVEHCGTGSFAAVSLVCSAGEDRTLVARKTITAGEENVSNVAPDLPEVSLYRPHPNIPGLIDHLDYSVLPKCHAARQEVRSHSLYQQYCNGSTLFDLNVHADFETPVDMANVFTWKLFHDLLSVFDHLHSHSITHGDGHAKNVFLHWPEGSKIPDFYLGDLGCARSHSINDRGAQTKIYGIRLDLRTVSENLSRMYEYLFTNRTGVDPTLAKAHSHLRKIILGLTRGKIPLTHDQELAELRKTVARNLRVRLVNAKDYSWARRTQPAAEPMLFDSRYELLSSSTKVPGPWRIAHVDPETFELQAVEATNFNLHVPRMPSDSPFVNARIPTIDKNYWDRQNLWSAAKKMDHQDPDITPVDANLFSIDLVWDLKIEARKHAARKGKE